MPVPKKSLSLKNPSDCHRCAGFVVTQAQAQDLVTYPFAVYGQGAGKRTEIATKPKVQAIGKLLGIDLGDKVVKGAPAGCLAHVGAFLKGEVEPAPLLAGQQVAVTLDGSERIAPGQQSHAHEYQQGGGVIRPVVAAGIFEVVLEVLAKPQHLPFGQSQIALRAVLVQGR